MSADSYRRELHKPRAILCLSLFGRNLADLLVVAEFLRCQYVQADEIWSKFSHYRPFCASRFGSCGRCTALDSGPRASRKGNRATRPPGSKLQAAVESHPNVQKHDVRWGTQRRSNTAPLTPLRAALTSIKRPRFLVGPASGKNNRGNTVLLAQACAVFEACGF